MKWNSTLYDESHSFVSKYGEGILAYLSPKPNESILDLGCGTGDLTQKIALAGSRVIGIDYSKEMIEAAKAKFPEIEFIYMSATQLNFDDKNKFDAIFSNAVLHWVYEKELAIEKMYSYLKKGGRIVLEFGGKGNNEIIIKELRSSLAKRGYIKKSKINPWYFPSIAEYSTELEKKSFRVIKAEHFDRFTPLKGDRGITNWLLMFGNRFFEGIPKLEKEEILDEIQSNLRQTHYIDQVWLAYYKRIRIIAIKE